MSLRHKLLLCACLGCAWLAGLAGNAVVPASAQSITPVPDTGWRLLLDPQASWQNDPLYLPEQVHPAALPVNPPTGGWGVLTPAAGISVSLPGSVEQYYWGKAPGNAYTSTKPGDIVNFNGSYRGVSWWYRSFTPPALAAGEHLVLSVPSARLRAEVYVNRKLVGYNIITEAPFDADLTAALKPGRPNQLAIRITSPGGEMAWADVDPIPWGKYQLPSSHGIGGLAGGLTLRVCAPVCVKDLAAYNMPAPKTVTLKALVVSSGPAYSGPVRFTVSPDAGGAPLWTGQVGGVQVPSGGQAVVSVTAHVPSAGLWDIGKPNLYRAAATLVSGSQTLGSGSHSGKDVTFGFRWFTARNVGTDAQLALNGRRFVVKSSITWGWWAPNGMFPDRAAVAREIADVKALGLNCLQNHRHMPKSIVLDGFDRAGLLRYCEAGAGGFSFQSGSSDDSRLTGPTDTSGKGGEAADFTMAYERDKLLAMVQAFRSHPSIPLWCVQNEISPDLRNPKLFYVLRLLHAADPSRLLVLKSGVGTNKEAWMMPYSDDVQYDHGNGVSGWQDQHTFGDSPGVYADRFYRAPTDFEYRDTNTQEIAMWGEMATSASTDNYARDLHWYAVHDQTHSYERDADKVLDAAYGTFLTSNGFGTAFPTTSSLFDQIANKHYEMAAKLLENGRMSDANDYLVLSGWESTTHDDHSGMVDALRLLKGDSDLVHQAAAPALLVVRLRRCVVALGGSDVVDVHLINEAKLKGPGTLEISATSGGASVFDAKYPVTVRGGDIYGEVLKDNITVTPKQSGYAVVTATLTLPGAASPALTRTEPFLCVNTSPHPLLSTIATLGSGETDVQEALSKNFGVTAFPLAANSPRCDVIVADNVSWSSFAVSNPISGTTDPGLYQEQRFGGPSQILRDTGLPNGPAKVELFFAETYFDAPGRRLFDVALNGQTVLKRLDIFQEAGGKDKALLKTFPVTITDGTLTLSVPAVEENNAQIVAVRITAANGQVLQQAFRSAPYTGPGGSRWFPVPASGFASDTLLEEALRRVHDDGTRLVFLTDSADAADSAAIAGVLADRKLLTCAGVIGDGGPSWLGFWYFGRRHWLLSGLPADCVLDWQYQIQNGNGLNISGPGLDTVIGYGHNHDPQLGTSAVVVPDGKGSIVLFCLPGLASAFLRGDAGSMDPVTADRLIYNSVAGPNADQSFPVLPPSVKF